MVNSAWLPLCQGVLRTLVVRSTLETLFSRWAAWRLWASRCRMWPACSSGRNLRPLSSRCLGERRFCGETQRQHTIDAELVNVFVAAILTFLCAFFFAEMGLCLGPSRFGGACSTLRRPPRRGGALPVQTALPAHIDSQRSRTRLLRQSLAPPEPFLLSRAAGGGRRPRLEATACVCTDGD